MSKYFTTYTSAEMICFITALVFLFNDKERIWRLFIPYMLLTCMVEIGVIPLKAIYMAHPKPINSNAWIYNLLLVAQAWFISVVFYKITSGYAQSKKLLLVIPVILAPIYIIEILSHRAGIFEYNANTYSLMSVLFVMYSLYFYYLMLNSGEYTNLNRDAAFWWVTGTLFFFFGTTATNLFYHSLLKISEENKVYITRINDVLIVILYGCWTYAFICKRWATLNK